jgi:hypothetical protein
MVKCNGYGLLVGKPEGKRPLGRPRCRWLDDMDLVEMGWGGVNWIDLALDRGKWRSLVNAVMNLQVLQNAGKQLSVCTTGGFLSSALLHIAS